MLEELLGLGVEGVDELGSLVNLRLNLLLNLRGFSSLVSCDLLLARVLVLGGLQLLAQLLRGVDHFGVVVVHLREQIPIRRELVERGSTQDKVEEACRARAIHAACAGRKLTLQFLDLGVRVVDLDLLGRHGVLGSLLLVQRAIIIICSGFQVCLKADQLIANGIGFGLLFSCRGAECDIRSGHRDSTYCCRCTDKRSP